MTSENSKNEGELHFFMDWREKRIEVIRLHDNKPGKSLGYITFEELRELIKNRKV